MRRHSLLLAVFAFTLHAGDPWSWNLPKGFPKPAVPAYNPMTAAKVELGRYLFYDPRLSVNRKASCATCHKQALAFTDGRAVSAGATGELHPRSAMSLVNIAWAGVLTWANPRMTKLEEQALVPMYGTHPVELGLRDGDTFLDSIRSDPKYQPLFLAAFPDTALPNTALPNTAFPNNADRVTVANVTKAIACFERSIVSARSPWDRYHYERDDNAISESAKRGEILFFSQKISCFRCHGGFNFGGDTTSETRPLTEPEFHNTGLYNPYSEPNRGVFEITHNPQDLGKFKAPTLRNIAITAPYMHDGSVPTLEAVLDHYAAGGRTIASGPHAGIGRDHPNKDHLIGGFTLSPQDRADLVEFLKSLTDEAILTDRRFANPWQP